MRKKLENKNTVLEINKRDRRSTQIHLKVTESRMTGIAPLPFVFFESCEFSSIQFGA